MVTQFVTSLYLPIPQVRLEKYRNDPACDLHMLTNYFWNIALCESLYPTLHAVELSLRNSIHTTLTNRYNTEEWWDVPRILYIDQKRDLDRRRQRYLAKYGVPITPGRLVAELNFGFWVIILSGHHVPWIWRWRRFQLVDHAFPNRAGVQLADIYTRFNDIRNLRNRVMHHERIFDRVDLRRDHADIHEAINWISPDLHAGIHTVDSFLEIHQEGWERAYIKLHKMLGGP